MQTNFLAKYTGQKAEEHKLPAYEAAQSLYGISRSLIIITNYLSEGRVRHRRFEQIPFEINIVANRPGSFETLYELICDPNTMAMLKDIAIPTAQDLLKDFIKSILNRAIGNDAEKSIEKLEEDGKLNAGDNAALVEAIEPALRETHKVIGGGASKIVIINGDNNIVNFNRTSKSYLNDSTIDENIRTKLFSIGGFSGNSGHGRAFDYEEGHTIAFDLIPDADASSVTSVLWSLDAYTRKKRLGEDLYSAIGLKYRAIRATDGRVKKILVLKARKEIGML